MNKKLAFTLAEVLITLGIIGVVAAMTMPILIAKHKEKQMVVQLKKVYSTLSQGYLLAVENEGTPDNWAVGATDRSEAAKIYSNILGKYFNVLRNCGTDAGKGCFPLGVNYKRLNGAVYGILDNFTDRSKMLLVDGTSIAIFPSSSTCKLAAGNSLALQNTCASFYVDVNGVKGPNVQGIDYFSFNITQYGIIPDGTQDAIPADSFDGSCRDKKTAAGWGCAAWVLINENMDYLRCNNLSLQGKTKCKE